MATTEPHNDATPDMLAALQSFADRTGRNWKAKLGDLWVNGRDTNEPEGARLRAVRNGLGPSWLFDECAVKPARKPSNRAGKKTATDKGGKGAE